MHLSYRTGKTTQCHLKLFYLNGWDTGMQKLEQSEGREQTPDIELKVPSADRKWPVK